MIFFHDWVDFWNGDWSVIKEKYGSLERAAAVYGGLEREALIHRYQEDMERARCMEAEYVVFHVSDISMEECFTYHFSHTNDQVITAALELVNELLDGKDWPFAFLVENQWWPGFTSVSYTHLTDALKHMKDALSLIKGDGHRLQNPAILRYKFFFLRVAEVQIVQNGRARDGNGTAMCSCADGHILWFHR